MVMMAIQTESNVIKLANLDNNISIIDQLGEHESPAILVNVFTVDPSETDRMMEAWIRDAEFMEAAARIHMDAASSRTRPQLDLHELCGLGERGRIQDRLRTSGISASLPTIRRAPSRGPTRSARYPCRDLHFQLSQGAYHD